MSQSLFAYLDRAPSLAEIASEMMRFGLHYRHTLPPTATWRYPIHVFGLGDLRVVYQEGDPDASRAVVNATVRRGDTPVGATQLRLLSSRVVRRWGGEVYDPHIKRKIAFN